jgi:hypothetical protein
MNLPSIDFVTIAATAKSALSTYGTDVVFILNGQTSGRTVKAVIYRDGGGVGGVSQLVGDVNSMEATGILNPDDFSSPYTLPKKFDLLKVNMGGTDRIYVVESVSPIFAANTLPLLLVKLKAN